LDGKVTLYGGDNRDVLKQLADNSVDSIVTDPPYALVSIVKRFGGANAAPASGNDAYQRASAGFMGKQWDTGEVAFSEVFWAECLRVLKPGGHVVAFSGTRTYHRMTVAIEDAGFEIRDQLAWVYGSGFPKSHDVSKAMDKAAGKKGVDHYTGANNLNEVYGEGMGGGQTTAAYEPATDDAREWQGWGTALKPAWEPIALGRKPLIGTVVDNVLTHGTGAINVDGCRVEGEDAQAGRTRHGGGVAGEGTSYELPDSVSSMPAGRWPANIIHDDSPEGTGAFPDGSARFFYSAKADKQDRIGSKHPTVKPVDLMQWLVRLITPKGGVVLDPFAGSGSTGEAAWREGMQCILVEREDEYQADIAERLRLADAGPVARRARAIKQVATLGPLFGDNDNEASGGAGRSTESSRINNRTIGPIGLRK
jgi:site-specific DNA-methyltransferase (adenine-specific)